jgi:hypothetical protein
MKRAVYACAAASAGSLLWWAFTGIPLWAPIDPLGPSFEGFLRGVVLFIAHAAPLLLATCFATEGA